MEEKIRLMQGAPNFRDIADLSGADADLIKPGVIFRSDEMSKLTDADVQTFKDLQIKAVYDMRTPYESASKPSRCLKEIGVQVKKIHIFPLGMDFNFYSFFWYLVSRARKVDFNLHTIEMYRSFINNHSREFKILFESLADATKRPAVIHCTSGKDRTGFVSALLQLLAGASRESIIENYLQTNNNIKHRIAEGIRITRWMSLFTVSSERIKPILVARAEYLDNALDELLEKFGSVSNYLQESCGLSVDTVTALKYALSGK